ncbi:MAG: cyclic nucleotide-binding domain-containing protein [Acidobacteria bacterium]|nr:cyclic nucleotide-binding domain-containing protein [Acidobacteriota bacterium]NIM62884.1 cyclic nucleotide-binding domain-containing protein [Acidobacteriota bacterium]NIO58827.1 cyclic nucleotide-binding domain-containing protein [Acidobacteriota bacterium]NIQ29884.1 cyclic nucleotide-binding domain-containing protein [Acidobacteriota bacterium]NIQ84608.1 cyclic nucleotide-binding domain-containing protein [Acidobacteriota bacterium]
MGKNPLQNFVVQYTSGQPVFQEGDLGATMYIVQSGRVRLYREVEGATTELGEMEKGDFFGEMSILEGLPRTTSAEAIENSELIEINSTTFDKMIRGNIEIAIRMLRKLSIRLRETERLLTERAAAEVAATVKAATQSEPAKESAKQGKAKGVRLEAVEERVSFPLERVETLIGRYDPVTEQSPDIDLTDLDLKRSVSRRHARILKNGESYSLVEEVGALNGTFVNGTKIDAGQPQEIADGDEIGIGVVKIIFRNA